MIQISFRWLRFLGLCLFIYIATTIDWQSVWKLLQGANLIYIIGYFLVFGMSFAVKTIRLRMFMERLGHQFDVRSIYACVVEPAFYGMLTPARVGEFSKVFHLVRLGVSQNEAWSVVLFERLVDFSVLMIASIAGLVYFFAWREMPIFTLFLFVIGMYLLLAFTLNSIGAFVKIIGGISSKFLLIASMGDTTLKAMKSQGRISARIVLPLSLVALLLSFVQLWMLGAALDITANGLYLGLAYTTSSLLSLLPISIGGLGTREAVYIGILGEQGIGVNVAVTISLLDGLVLSMFAQLILMIPLLKKPRNEQI